MSSEFLEAAEAIGRRIVDDAVWHAGRCNWVGVWMDPKEPWRAEYYALEPNLYDGTAGIGLFLAQLAAVTDDPDAHRTALGALRQSLARAPHHRMPGFHAGCLGIAWAATRTAELLGADELHAVPPPIPDACADLILGTAGSVLAHLALGDHDAAIAGGEQLLAGATVTDHGWSWADHKRPRRRHLTGLSHGTAGIAWALLELYAATGEDRFRAAAEAAFAYDSTPQPRDRAHRHARLDDALTASWCHGAAGVALTRLRAAEVLGPEPYEHEARAALEVTRRELVAAMRYDIDDLTLCHGASGAADALLCAGFDDVPTDVGTIAVSRYGPGDRWPCTPLGGTTPALFRGLAGIGWFFLRLYDPSVASPLALPLRLTAATPAA
ncbi:MAG TPA: lanthionine synthetase LanC family protein [Solirubrobacteraceae bacterium]|nr:lanthionine synthetase LanC family protein [Solirubrobacteraceae bacterium]